MQAMHFTRCIRADRLNLNTHCAPRTYLYLLHVADMVTCNVLCRLTYCGQLYF